MLRRDSENGRRPGFRLGGRLRRFVRACEGVAIVDFALVAPVLLFLMLGGIEAGRFMMLNQKLSRVATGTSDLMARAEVATVPDINQIFIAAQYSIRPFELGAEGVIFITSVSTDDTLPITPRVSWQQSGGGTLSTTSDVGTTVGQPANLPGSFTMDANQNIIIAEVFYDYTPFFFDGVMEPRMIRQVGLNRPRLVPLDTLQPAPPP